MPTQPPTTTEQPFWDFSCDIYRRNQSLLLGFQARHGLNINVLLWCVWIAAHSRGLLSKQELKRLLLAIHDWHQHIILPLRRLRDRLREVAHVNWAQPVRHEILATELLGEQIEQQLLIATCTSKRPVRNFKPCLQRAAHAYQNILTYCQLLYVALDENDCLELCEILAAVFPELSLHDSLALGRTIVLGKQKLAPTPKQQQLGWFTLDN